MVHSKKSVSTKVSKEIVPFPPESPIWEYDVKNVSIRHSESHKNMRLHPKTSDSATQVQCFSDYVKKTKSNLSQQLAKSESCRTELQLANQGLSRQITEKDVSAFQCMRDYISYELVVLQ